MSADLMVFDKSKVPAERLLSRNMNIEIFHLLEGADQAQGLAVVIDVFRAFYLECYLFSRGAQKIYAVGREETAWELKREHPEYLMAGERGGVILPGFDYGNSPSQTEHADFRGKILIHTTSAGTQGLVHTCAAGADEIITGSLVNASAIASYIASRNPERVSLVCMGNSGIAPAPEDELCARYIRSILVGEPIEMGPEILSLVNEPSVAKFFDIRWKDVFPVKDLIMCLEYDRFPFVLKACKCSDDVFEITRVGEYG